MIESEKENEVIPVPVDHIKAKLAAIGRPLDNVQLRRGGWRDGEFMIHVEWPDGFSAEVGIGPEASALIERRCHGYCQH